MSEPGNLPRRPGHWLEYVSTAFAVIVSLISLWVAIGSERANRQMVASSSWPFLAVSRGNVGPNGVSLLTFRVANSGVGPAKVRTFEVFYKGKPYPSSTALMRACCDRTFSGMQSPTGAEIDKWAFVTDSVAGSVIRAGESSTFISYGLTSGDATAWHALDRARQRDITYRVCYCSVFDECWINTATGSDQLDPTPVGKCPVPPVPYSE